MWFGVAPSPAPSASRPSTQTWHPPNCSCARHRDSGADTPLSPRMHLVLASPRTLHAESPRAAHAAAALQLAAKESHAQTAALGPASPRTHRRRVPQPSLLPRKQPAPSQQQLPLQQLHTAKTGPITITSSTRAAAAHTTPTSAVAKAVVVRGAMEASGALNSMQEPHDLDDDTVSHSNNSDAVPDASTAMDESSTLGAELLPQDDGIASDRKRLRSARRLPTGLTRPSTAARPATGQSDASDTSCSLEHVRAPPAPPKSRRASRTCAAYALSDPLEQQQMQMHHILDSHATRATSATLSLRLQPQPENLVGHTASVCAVAAHDDRYLVSCSIDGSVKIWSRASWRCLHTLFGHRDTVACVALHTRWLVSGSHDMTLRVYSCVDSFRLCHVLAGHTAHVTNVQLASTPPHHIVSCADDTTLRVWSAELGYCLFVLRDHASRVTCFVAHATRICSGGADAATCFWDLPLLAPSGTDTDARSQDIRATRVLHVHSATIQTLVTSTSSDATFVLSGSSDGSIQLFNLDTAEHVLCVGHTRAPIYSMCTLGSNQLVCSTGDGRVVRISDVHSSTRVMAELRVASQWISMLQLRGRTLVCTSEDALYVVDTDHLRVMSAIDAQHGFVTSVSWLHARALVSSGQDNVIKIWRLA